MKINRIEEILLEASTYFIKDQVIELAQAWYKKRGEDLAGCYEDAFELIMKQKGYGDDLI